VLPGVNKLSWGAPKHQTDFYVKDALRCSREVAAAVAELKAASASLAGTCVLFREALLVRVERKRLYDLPDWEARQAAHQVRGLGGLLCGPKTWIGGSALMGGSQRAAPVPVKIMPVWLPPADVLLSTPS